jgi:ATP-dependent Clp protease ATP-binding subunit ClpC
VSSREAKVLLKLEELLRRRIVGKDEAIQRVARVIRTRRAQLDFHPHRPDGAFLMVGPAGVGKNEFAYAVAEALYGDETAVVSLEMADYQEEDGVHRLVATPVPGREDLVAEGTLTGPVRANPRCILLLRGLEKAHPSVQRLLYQILEEGTITDAEGPLSFGQTILFATIRFSEEELRPAGGIGFSREASTLEDRMRELLKKMILPELVSAFTEVVFLGRLTPEDVRNIARYKVGVVLDRLKKQRRRVEVSDRVLDAFIREEEVHRLGASRLNRTLEEKLFHPLARYILEHRNARTIHVDIEGDRLVIQ